MKEFFNKTIRVLNLGLILFGLLTIFSASISPQQFWPALFFPISFSIQLLLHLLFIAYWAWRKKAQFLLSVGFVLAFLPQVKSHLNIHLGGSTKEEVIKVVSYNVHSLKPIEKAAKIADFCAEITALDADIYCLQEYNSYTKKNMKALDVAMTKKGLKYRYHRPYKSPVIYSRYPIKDKGNLAWRKSTNATLWVDIEKDGKKIRIYNLHLQSNKVSKQAGEMMEEGTGAKKRWNAVESIARRIKYNTQKRSEQAKDVAAHYQKSPYPVLLCGDFNDPPLSNTYAVLSVGLEDHFSLKGNGLAQSYKSWLPGLKIDYIFSDKQWQVLEHKIEKGRYSDHYPLWSKVRLKK